MSKYKRLRQKWVYAHNIQRLEKYDLLIDLASIHHVSRKMYETGKIKQKTIKKWEAREKKYTGYSRSKNCKHTWLPSMVFKGINAKFFNDGWCCLHCQCYTNRIDVDEAPVSFRCQPYLSRMRTIDHD
jgi:hypothetical protein